MTQKTWPDTKGHHWFDKSALNEMPFVEIAYGNLTTPMSGSQHVTAHRDTRLFGRIGAVARYDVSKVIDGKGFIMF